MRNQIAGRRISALYGYTPDKRNLEFKDETAVIITSMFLFPLLSVIVCVHSLCLISKAFLLVDVVVIVMDDVGHCAY